MIEENNAERAPLECKVRCVGIDNKQHVCAPDSDVCKCGVKVKHKKLLRDDYKLYSCYECTY